MYINKKLTIFTLLFSAAVAQGAAPKRVFNKVRTLTVQEKETLEQKYPQDIKKRSDYYYDIIRLNTIEGTTSADITREGWELYNVPIGQIDTTVILKLKMDGIMDHEIADDLIKKAAKYQEQGIQCTVNYIPKANKEPGYKNKIHLWCFKNGFCIQKDEISWIDPKEIDRDVTFLKDERIVATIYNGSNATMLHRLVNKLHLMYAFAQHDLLRALIKHEHQNKVAIGLSCGLLLTIGAAVYGTHKLYKKLHTKTNMAPSTTTETTTNADKDCTQTDLN